MSNPVYGKKAAESRNGNNLSVSTWLLLIGLILFLIWAPFQAGLFNGLTFNFEKPMFTAVVVGSLLLIVGLISFFKQIKLEDQRDLLSVLVLLLPITYLISLISAASNYYATNAVLVQCLYAFIFIIAVYMLQNARLHSIIETAMIAVAYIIVFFGLFNWLGQGRTVSAIVGWFTNIVVNGQYHQAVWIDSNGPRLASVFQYPNTYAAFLMAFLFVAMFAITRSKKWWGQAIHAFTLVPIALSILLTLSRGGLVFLPVVFVVLLLFLKPAKQILWIIYCIVIAIATLLISKPVTSLGQQFHLGEINDPAKGWFYVLAASVAVSASAVLVQRYLAPWLGTKTEKWSSKKLGNLWLPIGSVAAVAVLVFLLLGTNLKHVLPGNIGARLENINLQQHSVLERFTFYKDAVKVIKDYPVIGAGGGAWASIYERYQNNPYTSNQAHSFAMQYLVEVGILGFIVFLAFIIFIFYKYIVGYIRSEQQKRDSYFTYFIVVFSILIHSMMDFNMSYVFIGILVFIGLAGMAVAMDNRPLQRLSLKRGTMRVVYSSVLAISIIIVSLLSLQFIQSNNAVNEGRILMSTSTDYAEIKAPFDKALSKRSSQPTAILSMSSLYLAAFEQTQDESFYNENHKLLTAALKKEPYNKTMYKALFTLYQTGGEADKAYLVLHDNANRFVWDMEWYESLISQSYELGFKALNEQNTQQQEFYFNSGLQAYQDVVDGVEHLKTLPEGQLQGNPFEITQVMSLNAGKIKFVLNQPAEAAEILKLGVRDDLNDTTNREIIRYYLAALNKSGSNDEEIYNKLIAIDPTEADVIKQLTDQKF
ncbi:O-Antigen ligase [compost metagenome]